jgi:GT2 family glycosyltransferase
VAVVTIARGRHDHLLRQHRSLATGTCRPDHYVLVAMRDETVARWPTHHGLASRTVRVDDPGPLPLARARNEGARAAIRLGAETLVFLDVDCLAGPDLVATYAQVAAQHPGTVWSGPVTYLPEGLTDAELDRAWTLDDPHPGRPAPAPGELVPDADPDLFWSLSYAMDRSAWERSGGFCEDYTGYGGEDTDFAHQAASRGLDLGWVGGARAYHQHHPTHRPPTQHLDDILRNAALFHTRWGRWPMLGWLTEFETLGLVRRTDAGWVRTPSP